MHASSDLPWWGWLIASLFWLLVGYIVVKTEWPERRYVRVACGSITMLCGAACGVIAFVRFAG